MGKARVLGQYRSFVPNRYADVRRRPEATVNRRNRLERQREELEAAKIEKEIEAEKELEKRLKKYLEELK